MTMSADGVSAKADREHGGPIERNGAAENGAAHPAAAPRHKDWTIDDSARLYSIQRWGQGYFSINEDGHVAVHPTQELARSIDLKKLVDECRERDIQLPLLLRFTDILKHRVGRLAEAFDNAIREHEYKGR